MIAHNFENLSGLRFSRLIVLGRAPDTSDSRVAWQCQCDCGRVAVARAKHLKNGRVRSCGCIRMEMVRALKASHGMRHTRTYNIWANMIGRCTRPRATGYHYYGGRGIRVCERWLKFENFLADMGECPPALSIERVDNDGNYEPGNCKWATRLEQARNTSRTKREAA